MESDSRFFGRRAREELAAAKRAVTPAARERRMQLAEIFLKRFEAANAVDCTIKIEAIEEVTGFGCDS